MQNQVRKAKASDIDTIVSLSEKKRTQYQTYQPLFWRKAADSTQKQTPFLLNQLSQENILALVHEEHNTINGFVIANIGRGKRCAIDDFAIAHEDEWGSTGKELLLAVGQMAKESGILEYEVVCGHLDQPKRAMLCSAGLAVKQYWFTRAIEPANTSIASQGTQIQISTAVAEDRVDIAALLERADGQVPELDNERMTVFLGRVDGRLKGVTIGLAVPAPPVYDPGGDTCLVTELVVTPSTQQQMVCHALLNTIGQSAQEKGAVQFVVPCDSVDEQNQTLLTEYGMTIASEWYRGEI